MFLVYQSPITPPIGTHQFVIFARLVTTLVAGRKQMTSPLSFAMPCIVYMYMIDKSIVLQVGDMAVGLGTNPHLDPMATYSHWLVCHVK